ncbi:site-specific tyrosine recombinase XerD [Streptococcus massiliensis]|uniref:Tyrosine recombinase XerD-like n=1 Tax=Streptococcus massiliensis TaxID=313439 RepID=A0A380KXN3_9STRE|nr:site-specific tyrosine recombinase XerD [Streptococcus massiliensis]SUN76722.1 site-specific tyrosine recombinase XerD-like protein [Streptococcus massiliensis]
MKTAIQPFLEQKNLAPNSQAAYRYDLEQFVEEVGDKGISELNLRRYEKSLENFKLTVQKRKVSAVNQFLLYLYQNGNLAQFHKISLPTVSVAPAVNEDSSVELLELSRLWEYSSLTSGRLLALIIIELGLQPTEALQLEVKNIQLDFRILRIQKAGQQRILEIPTELLPEFEPFMTGIYVFGNNDRPYSRQWGFRQLESFLKEVGYEDLTAQKLREQHILRRRALGHDIHDIARDLGLKTSLTLEKYR